MTRRRRAISFAFWMVAALAALWLWRRAAPDRAPLAGLVEAVPMPLGPTEPGRVQAVHAVAGQTVEAGDPLVSFETETLDSELAVARAELSEILAALEVEARRSTVTAARDRLEAAARLAEARAQASDARARKAALQAELGALSGEIRRLGAVVDEGVGGYQAIGSLKAREERLRNEARHAPETVESWQTRAERLKGLLDALQEDDEDVAAALAPLRARAETQTRRIEALLRRRAALVLRAPRAGRVLRVLAGPGAAVAAGAAVIDLVAHDTQRLVAWLPERTARRLQPGTAVKVRAPDRAEHEPIDGVVDGLGLAISVMPSRLWYDANTPRFGRPVYIRLAAAGRLLPDEQVEVTVVSDAPTAGALAADRPVEVRPVEVPAPLAARTRLEVSAALWLPERARFLALSDDTGWPHHDEAVPWTFLIDRDGRVDPAPLPIDGADKVSDLEALARGPDGALYLLCSQSLSRKGRRPPKRQCLLRARLEGERLRADGAVQFFDTLVSGLDAETRANLGIGDALDLEGLAWYDGGLLIGVKSPLDSGRARLWHLTGVDALFAGAGFGPQAAKLRAFGALALPTGATDAPGGISELAVIGDQLYLASTLPEGPPCGAAWRTTLPALAPPRRLAAWPDLKPEALAVMPDHIRVFFDTGDRTPQMARLPLEQ
ncbi:MAG: HlyD family efflux transporter periplasmic adaptor subunit [Myxococcales bacterium]|nr:HlyD family efflux transporter periplasmic adaptor subunit [Myxococcales bacterium]